MGTVRIERMVSTSDIGSSISDPKVRGWRSETHPRSLRIGLVVAPQRPLRCHRQGVLREGQVGFQVTSILHRKALVEVDARLAQAIEDSGHGRGLPIVTALTVLPRPDGQPVNVERWEASGGRRVRAGHALLRETDPAEPEVGLQRHALRRERRQPPSRLKLVERHTFHGLQLPRPHRNRRPPSRPPRQICSLRHNFRGKRE